MRVLLIEDDVMIGRSLVRSLGDDGISVDWVRNGIDGATALANADHALVLLDLGLPGRDGIDLIDTARRAGLSAPLLVITARDDLDSRVKVLDLGADDYLVKPFESRELLARMRAVIRRQAGQARSILEVGAIRLDLSNHEASYESRCAVLPPREFALLHALVERPGTIFSRSQLEERIYGWGEEVESNAIDVLIHYVRKRLGKDVISNVRGAGWMVRKAG